MDFDELVDRRGTASLKWDAFGEGVIPLWVADMDFACAPAIVDAVTSRARHGVYGYTQVPETLVEVIVAWLGSRYGWHVEPEWLVWLPSLVTGLNLACGAAAEPGGAVMIVTPVYPPFRRAPQTQGCRAIEVPASFENGTWRLPLAALERAVTADTHTLLFCHPHNPLGRAWTTPEVAQLIEFCAVHELTLCSDEIHCDLLLDDATHTPAALAADPGRDLTITLMSPSKTFNLPGLNFAFAIVADRTLRERYTRAARGLLPYPGCFATTAAEAAYRDGSAWLTELLTYLRGNRDLVERFVAERLPGVSMTHVEATYLAWLDVRGLEMADPHQACIEAGVALSPGAAFGDPGHLRLNFACPRDRLAEGLRRLRAALV